jgi:hypothetical protein
MTHDDIKRLLERMTQDGSAATYFIAYAPSIVRQLLEEVKNYKLVLLDALKDDCFNDHSGGCWQSKAQELFGLDYEDEAYFENLMAAIKTLRGE